MLSYWHRHGHRRGHHTLKYDVKVFICDWQVTIRQAILYVDKSYKDKLFVLMF